MTILVGAIALLIGFFVFAFIGASVAGVLAAGPLHISAMEGGRGYFAIGIGLLTGIVGSLATLFLALWWRGLRGVKILIGGIASAVSIFVVAAAAVGGWYSLQPHVANPNGPEPILWVEVRAPPNISAESVGALTAELNTDRNSADVVLRAADSGDQLVRSGYVPLYYRTSRRLMVLKLPESSARLYNLHIASNPMSKKYRDWSTWQKPDFVDEPGSSGPKRAGDGADFEIRYRVETAGE